MYLVCIGAYTLLKVVSHYDVSVLSMSVMGFQNKKFGLGVDGWVSSVKFVLLVIFFHLCKSDTEYCYIVKVNSG